MKASANTFSIRQLLVWNFLLITLPAGLLTGVFASSIDAQIAYTQNKPDRSEQFFIDQSKKGAVLISIGSALRTAGLPLTTSSKLDTQNPHNLAAAQGLSDLCAFLIYFWLLMFLLGGVFAWLMIESINAPLRAITASISKLANSQLAQPVSIGGPSNVREIGQSLERLRLRLAENDNQQKLFLRHISHEIKTPLTSIKEGAHLLDDEILGEINSEQREITSILTKSTQELQISIENLLNYNSAVSVDSIKQRQVFDLAEVLESVLTKHELAIKKKRLKIIRNITPSRAFVDQQQIGTVFDNLLSNAIKYSPEDGKIMLWLKQDKKISIFTIRDYGPGVSEKHRPYIFDAFYVGQQSSHTTLKGTGLGLSIAKQLVEQHGGKIELLRTRQGAAFRVVLKR